MGLYIHRSGGCNSEEWEGFLDNGAVASFESRPKSSSEIGLIYLLQDVNETHENSRNTIIRGGRGQRNKRVDKEEFSVVVVDLAFGSLETFQPLGELRGRILLEDSLSLRTHWIIVLLAYLALLYTIAIGPVGESVSSVFGRL